MKSPIAGNAKPVDMVCIFASSSSQLAQSHYAFAHALGHALGEKGIGMIFGGGREGLMGSAADGVLEAGGRVVGVIPELLHRPGVAHGGIHELVVTKTMHERKAIMEDRADAFISLPGGFGTLEETLEVLTLSQLGYHRKPIVICNVGGYYDALLDQFEDMYAMAFANAECRKLYAVASTPREAVDFLAADWSGTVPDKLRGKLQA